MSEPQNTQELPHWDIHDGAAIQNALLNRVMNSDLAPTEQVDAVMKIFEQRQKGGRLIVEARKAGITFSQEVINSIGLNGVLALPGSTPSVKKPAA